MRALLLAGLCALAAGATPALAQTDNYPSRPVRIVVPYATGGGSDILARHIGAGSEDRRDPAVLHEHGAVSDRVAGGGEDRPRAHDHGPRLGGAIDLRAAPRVPVCECGRADRKAGQCGKGYPAHIRSSFPETRITPIIPAA